jgi:hypothetical protein
MAELWAKAGVARPRAAEKAAALARVRKEFFMGKEVIK